MKNSRDVDLAWLAGIVDGEGCLTISLNKKKKKTYFSVLVIVGMTHFPTIKKVAGMFGSGISMIIKNGNKTFFSTQVSGHRVGIVLPFIRPYLVTKAEQADVLIEFSTTFVSRGVTVSDGVLSQRLQLKERINDLNGSKRIPS